MTIKEMLEKRANLITQARAILEAANTAKRALTQEEQNQYDTLFNEANGLKATIDREERQQAAEKELELPYQSGTRPNPQQQNGNGNSADVEKRKYEAFNRALPYLLTQDFRGIQPQEWRALQGDLDTAGGVLRPPVQFVADLIKTLDNLVFMRQFGTVYSVPSADTLGVPTLENDPADADWTSELATGSEDSTMSFGRRELKPHPLAKRIKISRKLIRAVPNSTDLVRNRLAYKFAISEEKGFLTGNGAQQPLGIFTASTLGISTTRDVSTDNTTTAVTFDGLINAKYSLKAAYWPKAQWLAHRDFYKMVSKLKDGEGTYIWQQSLQVGQPDMLLGRPTAISEYAPNTFTTGLYVAMFADFSNYWIADAQTLEFQLLQELYAETNQVGMIGRLDCDGQPVLEEAFARVKLA